MKRNSQIQGQGLITFFFISLSIWELIPPPPRPRLTIAVLYMAAAVATIPKDVTAHVLQLAAIV